MCAARRRDPADQLAPYSARLREAATAAFVGRVAALLALRPRSIRQLSEESGVPLSTLRRIVDGVNEPTLSDMLALVAAFRLRSIEELIAPLGSHLVLEDAARLDTGHIAG